MVQLKRTPYNVAIGSDCVYCQARRLTHTFNAISNVFMAVYDFLELIRKGEFYNDSFQFINYITMKYWLRYSLLQESFKPTLYLTIHSDCLQ